MFSNLGQCYFGVGNFTQACAIFEETFKVCVTELKNDESNLHNEIFVRILLRILASLSSLNICLNQFSNAKNFYMQAINLIKLDK